MRQWNRWSTRIRRWKIDSISFIFWKNSSRSINWRYYSWIQTKSIYSTTCQRSSCREERIHSRIISISNQRTINSRHGRFFVQRNPRWISIRMRASHITIYKRILGRRKSIRNSFRCSILRWNATLAMLRYSLKNFTSTEEWYHRTRKMICFKRIRRILRAQIETRRISRIKISNN